MLGNRGTFASPGMQWISVGSGIEHAEGTDPLGDCDSLLGGGTPEGEYDHGFQIWVNVPRERKMDDPK
jgi:redox-sensitive bicupin YhaK (pirin superfamily)